MAKIFRGNILNLFWVGKLINQQFGVFWKFSDQLLQEYSQCGKQHLSMYLRPSNCLTPLCFLSLQQLWSHSACLHSQIDVVVILSFLKYQETLNPVLSAFKPRFPRSVLVLLDFYHLYGKKYLLVFFLSILHKWEFIIEMLLKSHCFLSDFFDIRPKLHFFKGQRAFIAFPGDDESLQSLCSFHSLSF